MTSVLCPKRISVEEAGQLAQFPYQESLLTAIHTQNTYTNENAVERLITSETLIKKLASLRIPRKTLENLLDLYCESGRLIKVSLYRNRTGYVLHSAVPVILLNVTKQLQAEYSKRHPGSGASLDNIQQRYEPRLDQEGASRLAETLRTYIALHQYQPDPIYMRAENISRRELAILAERSKQPNLTPAPAPANYQRSDESPAWKALEAKYRNKNLLSTFKKSLSELGTVEVINITLRRRFYTELLQLIREGLITSQKDLTYIKECLVKIKNRKDIGTLEKETRFQNLWDELDKRLGPSLKMDKLEEPKPTNHEEKLTQLSRNLYQASIIQKNRQIQTIKALGLINTEMMLAFRKFLTGINIQIDFESLLGDTLAGFVEEHFGLAPSSSSAHIRLVYAPRENTEEFLIQKLKNTPENEKLMVIFEGEPLRGLPSQIVSLMHQSQVFQELPKKMLQVLHWLFCEDYCNKHELPFRQSYLGFNPAQLKVTQVARQEITLPSKTIDSLDNPILKVAAEYQKAGKLTKDILAERLFDVFLANQKARRSQINFTLLSVHAFKHLLVLAQNNDSRVHTDFIMDTKAGLITFWMRILFSPECHWPDKELGKFVRSLRNYRKHIFGQLNKYENYVRNHMHAKSILGHRMDILSLFREVPEQAPVLLN